MLLSEFSPCVWCHLRIKRNTDECVSLPGHPGTVDGVPGACRRSASEAEAARDQAAFHFTLAQELAGRGI